jgi:hypothetical protein
MLGIQVNTTHQRLQDYLADNAAIRDAVASDAAATHEADAPREANPLASSLNGTVIERLSPQINTGRLAQLAENLDTLKVAAGKTAGQRFTDQAFGPGGVSQQAGSLLDGLRGLGGGHSRNPLDNALAGNFIGSRNARISSDPADGEQKPSRWETFKNWASSVATSLLGTVGGGATTVVTANTDSPASKADEFRGWAAFRDMATGAYGERILSYSNDKTPNPDAAESGGPTVITRADLNAIHARLGQRVIPADGAEAGSGGPVDTTSPNGAGGVPTQALYTDVQTNANVFNRIDAIGIQARIDAKINPHRP